MGIKHFEDLPAETIHRVLTATSWSASEKMDGSSITFGVDSEGNFYTRRKTAPTVYHSVDDWPNQAWCNSFRSAHAALETFMQHMQQTHPTPACEFEAEVIYGSMPNSTPYRGMGLTCADSIMITRYPRDVDWPVVEFTTTVGEWRWISEDGIALQRCLETKTWDISTQLSVCMTPMKNPAGDSIVKFLQQPDYFLVSCMEIIDCRLTSRPSFISEDDWHSGTRAMLKMRRATLRDQLRSMCRHLVQTLLPRHFANDTEGLVVEVDNVVFKLVDRAQFTMLNDFTHRVRYYLQGGSRPPRSSFMSRTQSWTVEARLHRLDQLRQKYLAHRERFVRYTGRGTPISYTGELHERTIVLFAELRERIQNGR